MNECSGKVVSGANIDGVTIQIHCCHIGDTENDACRLHPKTSQERFCEPHFPEHDPQCGNRGCGNPRVPPTMACGNGIHQASWLKFSTASKGSVRWRNQHYLMKMGKRGIPQFNALLEETGWRQSISAMLTSDPAFLLGFQQGTIPLEEYLRHLKEIMTAAIFERINTPHRYRRRHTKCAVYLSKSCGFVMSHRLCFRAESLTNVLLQVLIATDGGRLGVPCFLYYDSACSLLYFLAGILVTKHLSRIQLRFERRAE